MAKNALTHIADSKAAANRLAKRLTIKQLEKAIANLQGALDNAKKLESEKAAKKQAANLKKLKAMMAEMGLSAADLRKVAGKPPAKRKTAAKKVSAKSKGDPRKGKKIAPKYQLKVGKQTHKWTGRGRMPLVFKEHVAKGGSLEKCLIK